MCGIFGFTYNDKRLLESMGKIMGHRGPDHSGQYTEKGLSLGHKRLSIIDPEGGNQPMKNEDGTVVLVFNGQIYNHKEIREKLKFKHRFKSDSDSEVIVHAYEEWGDDCVNRFNGMFAFALWDSKKKRLVCARDRLGIKPFYYYFDPKKKRFTFASEIKALLRAGMDREMNLPAISTYFSLRYIPGEETAIKNIMRLPPGTIMVVRDGRMISRKYWNIDFALPNFDFVHNLGKYAQDLHDLLEDSVKARLMADVPISALLSGGLDSSSIIAFMAKHHDDKLRTLTLGFKGVEDNEFEQAKLISDHFGTEHKEISIGPESLKSLPLVMWHLEEPLADPTAIPNFYLAKEAAKDAKVLLNGDGADEIFAGYEQQKIMRLSSFYHDVTPNFMEKTFLFTAKMVFPRKDPFFEKLKKYAANLDDPVKSYSELISVFSRDEKKSLFSPKFHRKLHLVRGMESNWMKKFFKHKYDLVNSISNCELKTFLPDDMLVKFDKMCMANSIEGRVPFCDHRLVEFAAKVPPDMKLKKMTEKFILRRAMKGIIPKPILKRKKQRFFVPTDAWYHEGVEDLANDLLTKENLSKHKLFSSDYVNKLLNHQKRFKSYKVTKMGNLTKLFYSRQVWNLITFQQWYNMFIDDKKMTKPKINL